MRVLLVSALYPTPDAPRIVGGAEVFAKELAENLVNAGHKVAVVRARTAGHEAEATVSNGVKVHTVSSENIYQPFASSSKPALVKMLWHAIDDLSRPSDRFAAILESFKPEVIHTNALSGLTSGVWVLAAHRCAIVHTLHDYYLLCPRCSRFRDGVGCKAVCVSCRMLTVKRRVNSKAITAIVGVSRKVLDIHLAWGLFADTPIKSVIYNASDLFLPVPDKVVVGEAITIGFIGRITVEKGILNLIKAMAGVPVSHAKLIIAGRISASEEADLRKLAPSADLTFLGFVSRQDFYPKVDVVAIPSIWEEPGSLVLAEARAMGKPVLGTDFGGIPEVINPGVNGWISNAGPDGLRASILGMRKEMLKQMAGSTAVARKTRDVADEYERVYHAAAKLPLRKRRADDRA